MRSGGDTYFSIRPLPRGRLRSLTGVLAELELEIILYLTHISSQLNAMMIDR